jgi:hypothetical protein
MTAKLRAYANEMKADHDSRNEIHVMFIWTRKGIKHNKGIKRLKMIKSLYKNPNLTKMLARKLKILIKNSPLLIKRPKTFGQPYRLLWHSRPPRLRVKADQTFSFHYSYRKQGTALEEDRKKISFIFTFSPPSASPHPTRFSYS